MMKKIIITLICILLVVCVIFLININYDKEKIKNKLYQGTVKPTDDLKYFRETGITRPLGVQDGR